MPLGSERTLGLAGPYGTPLIAELPAPADPAGGVSCAKACPGRYKLPSTARTSAVMRDIWPSGNFDIKVSRGFPQARLSASPVMSALGQPLGKQRALTAVFANDRQITGESYHRGPFSHCVKTRSGEGGAESFSQLPSSESSCQHSSHRRNRDGSSTRKLAIGVFTQPGSKPEKLAISTCFPLYPG